MKINLTSRRIELQDPLRDYLISKLEGLERFYERIISVDVNLDAEKSRQIIDIVAHLPKKKVLKVNTESNDMYASIDSAVDKLKRQLQKYKEKMTDWRGPGLAEAAPAGTEKRANTHPQIVHTEVFIRKPMTPAEAALQLDSYHRDFLVFMNADTGSLNIIYRHNDGTYELLEPRY